MFGCGREDNFHEAGRKADVIDVSEGSSPEQMVKALEKY
jgi:hypothetical protein